MMEYEYPIMDVSEAEKQTKAFLLLMICSFVVFFSGLISGLFSYIFYKGEVIKISNYIIPIICIIISLLLIVLGIYLVSIIPFIKLFGEEIETTVLGNVEGLDKYKFSRKYGKLRLYADTKEGKKIILYNIKEDDPEYTAGTKIRIKYFKKLFIIIEDKK